MIPLVVGMPVFERAWVLNSWFDSLEAQDPPDGTRLIFALTPGRDATERIILRRWPSAEILLVEGLPSFTDDQRDDDRRFPTLAAIRNRLLRAVTALGPAHYLSWDSDIILEPRALRVLQDVHKDAVGALVDMGGIQFPGHWSYMTLDGENAYRPPVSTPIPSHLEGQAAEPFPTGVIMGCKLLSPTAYRNARYADHVEGEDIGFAIQLRAMGIQPWVVPAARGEHRWRLPASA